MGCFSSCLRGKKSAKGTVIEPEEAPPPPPPPQSETPPSPAHEAWTVQDGARYDGAFKAGRRHGYGKFTWANGDTYEGDWLDVSYYTVCWITPDEACSQDVQEGIGKFCTPQGDKCVTCVLSRL
uniref:MORN repeat-containing protein 5 n=1 Tax=Guillardia theta TaxID=55529 RepID=A0A7S4JV24_GUITH|mmetsp:Transcript_18950/g.62303  ORF Transcript_18950/g.62303 Transcript_18950/m.62303 type:complete len:124 (+) Transcript_18950:170-541(+)